MLGKKLKLINCQKNIYLFKNIKKKKTNQIICVDKRAYSMRVERVKQLGNLKQKTRVCKENKNRISS